MENPPSTSSTSRKNLENYANTYMGAYLNTVKKERPEHLPLLARNQFHEIEVCLMPNHCFAMLFEKAEKMQIAVKECGWDYVEGKVMSGVDHLVTVYAHEGVSVADAISRGKRDAVRDIRSLEDSDISKAVVQLEKILEGMTRVGQGNRGALKLGEQELARLAPIKDAIQNAGPSVDMLAMIDAMKNYPGIQTQTSIGEKEREMLQSLVTNLGDLSDVIRKGEAQDKKLEELEQSLKKTLTEINQSADERISKGLAVILAASDKKIDKGFAAMAGQSKHPSDLQLPRDLELRLANIEKSVQAALLQVQGLEQKAPPRLEIPKELEARLERLDRTAEALQAQVLERMKEQPKSSVDEELLLAVASLKEDIARTNNRVIKIEEFLVQLQMPQTPKVRVLKQK